MLGDNIFINHQVDGEAVEEAGNMRTMEVEYGIIPSIFVSIIESFLREMEQITELTSAAFWKLALDVTTLITLVKNLASHLIGDTVPPQLPIFKSSPVLLAGTGRILEKLLDLTAALVAVDEVILCEILPRRPAFDLFPASECVNAVSQPEHRPEENGSETKSSVEILKSILPLVSGGMADVCYAEHKVHYTELFHNKIFN